MRVSIIITIAVAFVTSCKSALYEEEECGDFSDREIIVNSETITLQSPGFSQGAFAPGQTCSWKIIPGDKTKKFVKINITDIDMPEHQRCDDGYFEIDYQDSIGPYYRYCGTTGKDVVYIPFEKSPFLIFSTSRLPAEGKGFKATLDAVDDDLFCGSNEHKCDYPKKCISESLKCDDVADCGDGSDEDQCGENEVNLEPKDICGIGKVVPDTSDGDRIVGGDEAIPHSWPWQVSIQANYIFPSGHICGGTLINSQWILTAGHCVAGTFWKVLRVKLGAHNQFHPESETVMRNVALVFFHPEYNRFTSQNDLALVKLSTPVEFTSSVAPACLPHYFEKEEEKVGQRLFATGWGETLESGLYDHLRQVATPVVELDTCKQQLSNIREVFHKSICTGYDEGGRNPCFGDSGGPLVGKRSSGNQNQWVLKGVVSWGPTVCGQAQSPTVFAKVSEYGDWIRETITGN